ncbi:BA71V-E248R (k2R) [African swine fever virus]|uniref:Inner membrane protein pE248R n=1 Tax=African swine fever virus TaxID=10497 RepID=A0A894ZZ14_ASF|nr:BA71V-E248R (k2R) [African swine fever virus]QXP49914.1 BA71V-E248R (k2R) [African swine fever virus]
MGGSTSKNSFKNTTNIISHSIFNQMQSCISMLDGKNYIGVFGDGNIINHIFQDLNLSLNTSCVQKHVNEENFITNLSNQITQNLKDQEVALTQWMDAGHHDQKTDIEENIKVNLKTTLIQNCVSALSGMNVLVVKGNGNIVENATQKQSQQIISNCLQGSKQAIDTTTGITNTVNQYSHYTSKNFFEFIADAISAVFKNIMVAAVVIVVIIVGFIAVFYFLHSRHRHEEEEEAEPLITSKILKNAAVSQ